MTLADRVARLEARLRADTSALIPSFFIVLDDEGADNERPIRISHASETFEQHENESDEVFRTRVLSAVLPSRTGGRMRPVQPLFVLGERYVPETVNRIENTGTTGESSSRELPQG